MCSNLGVASGSDGGSNAGGGSHRGVDCCCSRYAVTMSSICQSQAATCRRRCSALVMWDLWDRRSIKVHVRQLKECNNVLFPAMRHLGKVTDTVECLDILVVLCGCLFKRAVIVVVLVFFAIRSRWRTRLFTPRYVFPVPIVCGGFCE